MVEKHDDDSVMANLPATRPSRLSRRAKAAAETPAKPAKKPAARKPAAKPEATGPTPVRAGSPNLDEPARKAEAARDEAVPAKQQNPAELATTVVKAAGELAQIGATVAGQVLKRAVDRLPKP